MKPRTCSVQMWICNDQAMEAVYMLHPLPAAELAGAVCGFRLTKTSVNPSPVYKVRLLPAGLFSCDCPQHNFAGVCKHGDALMAAGILPSALVSALEARTQLLDAAEAECVRLAAAGSDQKTAHELDAEGLRERIADLEAAIQRDRELSQRRRRRRTPPVPIPKAA